MKFASILAVGALALATPLVHAQDIIPQILIEATPSAVPGRIIDIRNLVPGMTADEVRPVLAAIQGSAPNENLQKTALSGSGTSVTGTPYTRSMSSRNDGELIEVFFSGVSSSNQTYLIRRELDFGRSGADAPLFDAFVDALVDKYGTPSLRKDGTAVTHLMWTYKNGRTAACNPDGTPQCLQPDSAISNLPELAETFDVIIYAAVARERGANHVTLAKMSSTDLVRKAAADQADTDGLRPALDAAIAAAAANAPKPEL